MTVEADKRLLLGQLEKHLEIITEYERHHASTLPASTQTLDDENAALQLQQEEYQWYHDQYLQMQSVRGNLPLITLINRSSIDA